MFFQTVHSSRGYLKIFCPVLESRVLVGCNYHGVLGVERWAALVEAAVCDDSGQGSECTVRVLDLDVSCLACPVRVVRVETLSLRTATARARQVELFFDDPRFIQDEALTCPLSGLRLWFEVFIFGFTKMRSILMPSSSNPNSRPT